MKALSHFFFYCYCGLAVAAGCWGAFGNPQIDFSVLFHFPVRSLDTYTRVNLLDQYRFLRGIELAFGMFCLAMTREIFSVPKYNLLFLAGMSAGTTARIVSLFAEGRPSAAMCFFLIFELAGIVVISVYSFHAIHHKKLPYA
jgi:hypothetical protein